MPVAMAARGIPSLWAVAGSCASVMPPAPFTSFSPSAPSAPVPERTTATALERAYSASERKNVSIGRNGACEAGRAARAAALPSPLPVPSPLPLPSPLPRSLLAAARRRASRPRSRGPSSSFPSSRSISSPGGITWTRFGSSSIPSVTCTTGTFAFDPSSSGSMLSVSGAMCCTTTNAMPVSAGMPRSSSVKASSAPALPPTATVRKVGTEDGGASGGASGAAASSATSAASAAARRPPRGPVRAAPMATSSAAYARAASARACVAARLPVAPRRLPFAPALRRAAPLAGGGRGLRFFFAIGFTWAGTAPTLAPVRGARGRVDHPVTSGGSTS
jgi:hypothetical protein